MVRVKVTVRGTRTLLQNTFGPEAIPLEKQERTGVAGNDPGEWKKTCMLTEDRRLYMPGTYIFGCLKNGAVRTKKGRGSIQADLVATLQVEEDMVLTNRTCPPEKGLKSYQVLTPPDPEVLTFIYVGSVRNPATKGRNIRYRLATRAGWRCRFTLAWDKTVVAREQMRAVLRDSGVFGGLGDGIKIGCGRFDVEKYEELDDAAPQAEPGAVAEDAGNGVAPGRPKMRPVR